MSANHKPPTLLDKSLYMLGVKCPKALWLQIHMPDEVAYVNSHGTGTPKNDPAETGPVVMLALTRPLVGLNVAFAVRLLEWVSLLAALGWFPPPLMHAYVALAVVTFSV